MTDMPESTPGPEQDAPTQPGVALEPLPREPLDPRHLSLYEISTIASSAAKSRYFSDAHTSAACAVKLLWGQEVGIPPMAALSGIHIAKGKPSFHYSTIGALVKRAGYKVKVLEHDEEHCVLEWWEPNDDFDPEQPVSDDNPRRVLCGPPIGWSMQEARKAGVVKDLSPWTTYPKVMLYARALSIGARIYAPDVFFGAVYTEEELREENGWDTEAEAVEVPTADVPEEPAPPVVVATPPEPTEQLASPSQRGALWLKAKDKMTRAEFESLIKLTFGVTSLDRLPARLIGNATTVVENYQSGEPSPTPADVPPEPTEPGPDARAGAESDDTSAPAPPTVPTAPPQTSTTDSPGEDIQPAGVAKADAAAATCTIQGCEFDAFDKGLCVEHSDELRGIGSIAFNLNHPEWSEQ